MIISQLKLIIILSSVLILNLANAEAKSFNLLISDSLSLTHYEIPASDKVEFINDETGLGFTYPKNFTPVDNRNIIKDNSGSGFFGVTLMDSSLVKKPQPYIFITFDDVERDYDEKTFTNEFIADDNSIRAYKSSPRTLAGVTTIRYYFFTETKRISIAIQTKKDFLDSFLPVAEAIIRSIKVSPPSFLK